MLVVPVEVPTQVLNEALPPSLADDRVWDTHKAVPDAVALAWLDGEPACQWSVSLLSGIDPASLPASELPT